MTANTLAEIGDGRFRVGLGTSGLAVIKDFHRVTFDRPLRRTREYVEIVRAFLSCEQVDYEGECLELANFAINVDDYHECPIYFVAMDEINRQFEGEFGDGWIPLLLPNTALDAVEHGTVLGDLSIDRFRPWTSFMRVEPRIVVDSRVPGQIRPVAGIER